MPRGYVVIRVKEASGKNRGGNVVWDPTFTEGFIRAEMRSGDGSKIVVSMQNHAKQRMLVHAPPMLHHRRLNILFLRQENSTKKHVNDFKMTWNEEIRL